jgi:hypothetical protein
MKISAKKEFGKYCRLCKLTEEQSPRKKFSNGKPKYICIACEMEEKARNVEFKTLLTISSQNKTLFRDNYLALYNLQTGSYELTYRANERLAGFILIRPKTYYVYLYEQEYEWEIDLWRTSLFFSNKNVAISHKPVDVTKYGKPILAHQVHAPQLTDLGQLLAFMDESWKKEMLAEIKSSYKALLIKGNPHREAESAKDLSENSDKR